MNFHDPGNDADRLHFKKVKCVRDCMLKTSYNNYFGSLVGFVDN